MSIEQPSVPEGFTVTYIDPMQPQQQASGIQVSGTDGTPHVQTQTQFQSTSTGNGLNQVKKPVWTDPEPTRPISLLLCTPCYSGGISVNYMSSVLRLDRYFKEKGIPLEYFFIFNESLITRGRNALVDTYLKKTQYTHMLFIDSDIEFEPEDVYHMLIAQKPICCGAYSKKAIAWDRVFNYVQSTAKEQITEHALQCVGLSPACIFEKQEDMLSKEKFIKIMYGATGIMMIDRKVFEAIMESDPNHLYVRGDGDTSTIYNFFDTIIHNGNLLSEDYYFCEMWKRLGGDVWLMNGFRCRHYGYYGFG